MSWRERRGIDVNLRSGPQMREYVALADRIAADRPGRVLDWGCGYGQVTALLRDRDVEAQPFDYRENASEPGTEQLERFPEITVTVSSDPVALPFEDDSFDAVLSCGVLEHVPDPAGSLDELHRVLRPGGRLYVVKLPNRASYLEWIARRIGVYYHGQYEHDQLYTPHSATALVAAHRFHVQDVRLANMLPLTLANPLAIRLSGLIWRANRALARAPLVRRLATNIEVDAVAVR